MTNTIINIRTNQSCKRCQGGWRQPKDMTAYVVACYMKPTPPDGNTYTSFKDGNGVQCWLDTRYTHLLQANEPVNRALWFARSRARGRCMSTDRVWKVVYNNKTDKITKWIKKNP